MSTRPKIDGWYVLVSFFAVLGSWTLHEFFHWIAANYIGYPSAMRMNKTIPLSGIFRNREDYAIVSAAGPIITIIEAIVFFLIIRARKKIIFYPFLLTCFYMRLLATGMSVRNPNDEARISSYLGLGSFTLPLIVSLFLFFLVFLASKELKPGLRFNLISIGLILLFSSGLIITDQYFQLRLL